MACDDWEALSDSYDGGPSSSATTGGDGGCGSVISPCSADRYRCDGFETDAGGPGPVWAQNGLPVTIDASPACGHGMRSLRLLTEAVVANGSSLATIGHTIGDASVSGHLYGRAFFF